VRAGGILRVCVGCKEVGTCGRLCVSRCGVPNVLEEQQPSTSWGWPLFRGGRAEETISRAILRSECSAVTPSSHLPHLDTTQSGI
jgi:hypothetical protein